MKKTKVAGWIKRRGPDEVMENSVEFFPRGALHRLNRYLFNREHVGIAKGKGRLTPKGGLVRKSFLQKQHITLPDARSGRVFCTLRRWTADLLSADTKMPIYTSSGCKFKEIIFLFFCNKQAQEQVATLQRF